MMRDVFTDGENRSKSREVVDHVFNKICVLV